MTVDELVILDFHAGNTARFDKMPAVQIVGWLVDIGEETALFKFFINHQNDGQIIILENMMHIPALDYEGSGANVITFTKGLEAGRYGFLNDVK